MADAWRYFSRIAYSPRSHQSKNSVSKHQGDFELLTHYLDILYNFCMDTKLLPIKPTINFNDLDKIDVRIGRIEMVADIEKSDKLVRLTVNFGDFKRNILVGLKKERKNPKEIEGKQALFVVNLEPKEMMGEVSEGMLFDIGYSNKITPVLAIPEKEVPDGISAG